MPKLTDLVAIPANINVGLKGTGNALMLAKLGNPRSQYGADCRPVTHPVLKTRMKTENVGPFKVTGFDLAVDALKTIMTEIKVEQASVYAALGTAGMLCCRLVRGSTSAISNHSWGTAIDLTLSGVLDPRGDGKVQHGLTLIAPIFNKHGWFWGAGFPKEDAMHFEVSAQLFTKWMTPAVPVPDFEETIMGDRGAAVAEMQRKLNKAGEDLVVDGVFGAGTHAALLAFQARNGLRADGVAGAQTWAKLNAV
jgi:hypothetical protein